MINRECARVSRVSADWNKWFYRTGQSNHILNEIFHSMAWFGFAVYIKTD